MIIMCFIRLLVLSNHLIFCDDPLFLGGKDFGYVSRQNVIMIMYLLKSHVVVVWENGRFCEESVVTFFI